MNHLLFEFYKELKHRGAAGPGGPTRSLSLALRKFAALCAHIKTSRRRSYVTNLLPCLAKLAAEREEEVLLDAFREALPRLCAHLLRYATDSEVKVSCSGPWTRGYWRTACTRSCARTQSRG